MSENTTVPIISIYGKKGRISIGRPLIRLLGSPTYVCLYQTTDLNSIALGPCEAKNHMSFKVSENAMKGTSHSFEICSIRYVKEIMRVNNLDCSKSYRISGTYLEEKGMATFKLSDAIVVGGNA